MKSHDFSCAIWNKQALVNFFQRPQIALVLWACAILLVFKKIYSCLFIPNCTQNHVITYTNKTASAKDVNADIVENPFLNSKCFLTSRLLVTKNWYNCECTAFSEFYRV